MLGSDSSTEGLGIKAVGKTGPTSPNSVGLVDAFLRDTASMTSDDIC